MHIILPDKVNFIIETLERHGFEAYAVGGCVRDSIIGREPKDWDITTSARPEEVCSVFRRTVDTGMKHGTVTVMLDREGFEVTTYRIDGNYSDGRHPDSVSFTPHLAEDLRRRDFTINAMAYHPRAGLIDLFGGEQDLRDGVIRCVGDPDERFHEDTLRIMRAVRFAARFGFRIDGATRAAIAGHAGNLTRISAERIRDELVGTITSPHPEQFRDFHELGVTGVILPEFDVCMDTPQHTPHHRFSVGGHILCSMTMIPPERILRLTMLLHDIGKPAMRTTDAKGRDHFKGHAGKSAEMAEGILRRLRFDNETRKKTVNLIRWHDLRPKAEAASVRRAVHLIGEESFRDYLAVQRADNEAKSFYKREEKMARLDGVSRVYEEILARGDCLNLKDLQIDGNDLKEMGISGRCIGEYLEKALDAVLEDPSMNDREKLIRYVGELCVS